MRRDRRRARPRKAATEPHGESDDGDEAVESADEAQDWQLVEPATRVPTDSGNSDSLDATEFAIVAGLGVGAVVGALASFGVAQVSKLRRERAAPAACRPPASPPPPALQPARLVALAAAHAFDCFISYRRSDFRVVDLVDAQLQLSGLRTFKARSARACGCRGARGTRAQRAMTRAGRPRAGGAQAHCACAARPGALA